MEQRPQEGRAMAVKTSGLYHLHLLVADVERSVRFYGEVFGARELFREGPDMVFVGIDGTETVLTFRQGEAAPGVGVDHFGFGLSDPADMETAIKEVEAAGGRLVRRGEHAPGSPFAYCADPDGYVFEL
jgi:catechol 2,3-dioxygenase-like lactoylglutathione lyase family enzyme